MSGNSKGGFVTALFSGLLGRDPDGHQIGMNSADLGVAEANTHTPSSEIAPQAGGSSKGGFVSDYFGDVLGRKSGQASLLDHDAFAWHGGHARGDAAMPDIHAGSWNSVAAELLGRHPGEGAGNIIDPNVYNLIDANYVVDPNVHGVIDPNYRHVINPAGVHGEGALNPPEHSFATDWLWH